MRQPRAGSMTSSGDCRKEPKGSLDPQHHLDVADDPPAGGPLQDSCTVNDVIAVLLLALVVTAPPSLTAVAERVRAVDQQQLEAVLADAGLALPGTVRVTLIDEDDPRARGTPWWIVGVAVGTGDVAIFPARAGSYPYESLESVLRPEVVHLAL